MTKQTWFTADNHFGHKNIIKHCNRPFKNLKEMDKQLITNWNKTVNKNDTVIILGDFSYKSNPNKYINKLNGHKIFILGNHDNPKQLYTNIIGLSIQQKGIKIWCTHDPKDIEPKYELNLCGHIHNKWKIQKEENTITINVGIDLWDFKPINIQDIMSIL